MNRLYLKSGIVLFLFFVFWDECVGQMERQTSEYLLTKTASTSTLHSLFMSPNNQRYIQWGWNGMYVPVIDGKALKSTYHDYSADYNLFSPNSKRYALKAKSNDKWVVILDGKEHRKYDAILSGTPIFVAAHTLLSDFARISFTN